MTAASATVSATAARPARTEREVRIDLAAAYRLAALAGWDDTIYTHLSAAVPGEPGGGNVTTMAAGCLRSGVSFVR